ncbi:ABC transporter permease [Thermotoga sp. 38H-to]|jgi:peptide/nickel transport system permease protein|uniref:ABC transporter permease n=1 Tax=Thermotoga sp. 38H-to TaxID=1755812 RepID=UPI00040639DB|nr:ABC transporter permease [Thermotoga sp. 38H-to]KAF2959458.1 peptide ABC transporter [Thermotoga sp. 38H-to]
MSWQSIFLPIRRLFKYDVRFRFAIIVLIGLVGFSLLSFLSPYDARSSYYAPINHPPSWKHPFGTNGRGQDLFWLLTFAMKNSLVFSLEVALLSRLIAIFVGITAGYKRGILDQILVLLCDSFIVLPLLPILIFLKLIMREMNFTILALVLSLFGWPWDARFIRSQILSLRERNFTYSAIFSGRNLLTMIFSDYLPHILPITLATTVNNMLWSLGFEITLSILGLTSLDVPTMGTVTYWAIQQQAMVMGIWWWLAFPIGLLVLLFISLYFLFVSITDYINPKARIVAR